MAASEPSTQHDWSQLPMDARPDVRSDAHAIAHAVAQAVPVAYTLSHRLQGSALVRSQFGAHTSADDATHHFTSIAATDGTADAHPRAQSGIAACTCGEHGPGTLSGFSALSPSLGDLRFAMPAARAEPGDPEFAPSSLIESCSRDLALPTLLPTVVATLTPTLVPSGLPSLPPTAVPSYVYQFTYAAPFRRASYSPACSRDRQV